MVGGTGFLHTHCMTSIVPDEKDWTWVLERKCPECGFDAARIERSAVPGMIRTNADQFATLLGADVVELRTRARADRWSTLEYAAHVRDVYRLYLDRLTMMLDQDDPLYPNWDQDVTAVEDRYNEQDPAEVAREVVAAADAIAVAFASMDEPQWRRPGRRSDGAQFTVDTFARYLVHDPIHHLHDVESA